VRRLLKHFLGMAAFRSGAYRRFFRDRALVVLLHRVNDRLKDNPISCPTARFAAYCGFFARYFHVISLGELLQKLAEGGDLSCNVVITFDDGYKDNHEVAARTLRRFGLPACFFVATNFIGSTESAWWDVERGITSQWMSWEDVRSLRKQGFEIGSHTMNHVDLGTISGRPAVDEIVGAKERLAHELNEDPQYFSYPYGGREHLSAENREAVRRAGYTCCLSAYGGSVMPKTDFYNIQRVPLSPWYISPYQLGFEAMSWSEPPATADLGSPSGRHGPVRSGT
jgi:peptidoglycan/xylan/chitin deacetylase (PgdA/CDA1 family)